MVPDPWTDSDRLSMFDAALSGASDSFGRLNGVLDDETNLHSLIELIWWLGAAIDSMCLQHGTGDLNAGLYWVRNCAAHKMWRLFRLVEPVTFDHARYDHDRYDDWVFDDIEVVGEDRATIEMHTQRWGYVCHLEGKSVRLMLSACWAELDALRS